MPQLSISSWLIRIYKHLAFAGMAWGMALSASIAWAQQTPTTFFPSTTANCVVGAQNRYAPLNPATGQYVLPNLPGNGLIPFGVAASAQPFRVRATCDDGSVGETPIAFPQFEQRVVTMGDIVWGQKTPIPTQVQIQLPKTELRQDERMNSNVIGIFPDASQKNLSDRSTGTGYRSSAPTYIGVTESGEVFSQSLNVQQIGSWVFPAPARVIVSAENDGVIGSKAVSMKTDYQVAGVVRNADGSSVSAGVTVVALIDGQSEPKRVTTDAQGQYVFTGFPVGYSCMSLVAIQLQPIRLARSRGRICVHMNLPSISADLQFLNVATVQFSVKNSLGQPVAGMLVGYADPIRQLLGAIPMPTALTDAQGIATFGDVPVGSIVPVVASSSATLSPASFSLLAGQTQVVNVTINASSLANAVIKGRLTVPDGSAAIGARVEIQEQTGLARKFSHIVDSTGNYRFDELLAGSSHRLIVSFLGSNLVNQVVETGAAGSEFVRDFVLNPGKRLFGRTLDTDGVTPILNASVQLSEWNPNFGGTWVYRKNASIDGNGLYQLVLDPDRRYKVDAFKQDGSVASLEITLASNAPASTQRDIVFQAQQENFFTRVSIAANLGADLSLRSADGLSISVTNTDCPTSCSLTPPVTGAIWVTDYLPRGLNQFSVNWMGQQNRFDVNVGTATANRTISQTVAFAAGHVAALTSAKQRSWVSFQANEGELIDITALGMRAGDQNPAYAVRVELVDPRSSPMLLTSTIGFDPARVPVWSVGAVRSFVAPSTGTFTLIVSTPYPDEVQFLGGYGLNVKVGTRSAVLAPWPASEPRQGGILSGHVISSSNTPMASLTVLVRSGSEEIPFVEPVITDQTGYFAYANVPAGAVSASAVSQTMVLATTNGSLVEGGSVTLNIQLPRLVGRVLEADGSPLRNAGIALLTSDNQVLDSTITGNDGEYGFATAPQGLNQRVAAYHPISGRQLAVTVDIQQSTPITIAPDMVYAGVRGRVVYFSGRPAANLPFTVEASDAAWQAYGYTDSAGEFVFTGLPPGANAKIIVTHPVSYAEVRTSVNLLSAQIVNSGDVTLPRLGSVSGRVRDTRGVGMPNVVVHLEQANSNNYSGCGVVGRLGRFESALEPERVANLFSMVNDGLIAVVTDAQGVYRFDNVPSDTGDLIAEAGAVNPNGLCEDSTSSQLAAVGANEDRILPDIVFPDRTQQGQVRVTLQNPQGQPLSIPLEYLGPRESGECYSTIRLSSDAYGSVERELIDTQSGVLFSNLPHGIYRAQLYNGCSNVTIVGSELNVTDSQLKQLQITISTLSGRVTTANGNAVSYPNVSLVRTTDENSPPSVYYSSFRDEQGRYAVVGADLVTGTYVLTVSGTEFGAYKAVTGTFSVTGDTLRDVAMNGIGSVSGRLLTASGNPAGFGFFEITNPAHPGAYYFDYTYGGDWGGGVANAPVGTNTIFFTATDPSQLVDGQEAYSFAMTDVMIETDGQTKAVADQRLLPFGHLEVTTLNAAGTAPLAAQRVLLQSTRMERLLAGLGLNQTSNGSGVALFTVPAMSYNVTVVGSAGDDLIAGSQVINVPAGATLSTSLVRSGSLRMAVDSAYLHRNGLATDDGSSFLLSDTGGLFSLRENGFNYKFYEGPSLIVNGFGVPDTTSAQWISAGRELLIGPYSTSQSILVSRRLYVPTLGGYARLLDSVTNQGSQTQVISVVSALQRDDSWRVRVSNAESNGNYLIMQGSPYAYTPGMFSVVYGDGISFNKPLVTPFVYPNLLQWTLTVPPGQTSSIVHYHMLEEGANPDSLKARSLLLVNKAVPNMFEGLSTTDKQSIKNFAVQP